jgi:hypothetical protein
MNLFKLNKASSSTASIKSAAESTIDLGPVTHEPILTPPTSFEPVLNPPLDEEQKKKAQALMEHTESIMLPKEDEYYPNERAFLSEATIHRYLRARKWDLEVI